MTLWIVAHQAPLSLGFPRQEYFPGGSAVKNLPASVDYRVLTLPLNRGEVIFCLLLDLLLVDPKPSEDRLVSLPKIKVLMRSTAFLMTVFCNSSFQALFCGSQDTHMHIPTHMHTCANTGTHIAVT